MNKLKEWLDNKGLSCAAFARLAKINSYCVLKAYKGEPLYNLSNARKIARYTNNEVTVDDLRIK